MLFTGDYTSNKIETWKTVFAPIADRELSILEIGSFEGRSAIFFLQFFPRACITCVDTFGDGGDLTGLDLDGVEDRFDLNLRPYAGRVEKLKARSLPALDQLSEQGRRFDLIYIDGSHLRDDVLLDTVLSWRLLNDQGHMIWDDYEWQDPRAPDWPKPAIDAFLRMNACRFKLLYRGWQVIVQKTPSDHVWSETWGRRIARTPRNLGRFFAGSLKPSL